MSNRPHVLAWKLLFVKVRSFLYVTKSNRVARRCDLLSIQYVEAYKEEILAKSYISNQELYILSTKWKLFRKWYVLISPLETDFLFFFLISMYWWSCFCCSYNFKFLCTFFWHLYIYILETHESLKWFHNKKRNYHYY